MSRRRFIGTATAASAGLFLGCSETLSGIDEDQEEVFTDPNYILLLADTHIDQNPNRL
jgi:hypothetical protein